MFEAVNPPVRSRRQQFVTLAASIVAHVAIVGGLLILPLLYFSDQLPKPPDMLAFVVASAPPPPHHRHLHPQRRRKSRSR